MVHDFLSSGSRIGIWGLGIVGRSLIPFLANRGYELLVCDARELSDADKELLASHKVTFFAQGTQLVAFLETADVVVPSGGIDVSAHAHFNNKWLPELDIFYFFCTKPIIAITGTVGKTTTTYMITKLLERAGKRVLMGGNIGVGLCDLLEEQESTDFMVIEVSSFQLEYCRYFAPTYAIWTNLYPNHLDRHGSMEGYLAAKAKLIKFQHHGSVALLPSSLYKPLQHMLSDQRVIWCGATSDTEVLNSECVYIQEPSKIVVGFEGRETIIAQVPPVGFVDNWLFIAGLFEVLQLPLHTDIPIERTSVLAHRIELVQNVAGRDVFNDSKATIMQATLGALDSFRHKTVHLLLGGLSKGVNRGPYLAEMKNRAVRLYMFGAEAEQLAGMAHAHGLNAEAYQSLELAYLAAFDTSAEGDIILLSPGGSSFDTHKNYQERGADFIKLVSSHAGSLAKTAPHA